MHVHSITGVNPGQRDFTCEKVEQFRLKGHIQAKPKNLYAKKTTAMQMLPCFHKT